MLNLTRACRYLSGLSKVLAMKPHVPGVNPRRASNSSAVTLPPSPGVTVVSYGDPRSLNENS